MTRLHCAKYVIPLHRPWWERAWRWIHLAWLKSCLECVAFDLERNTAVANMPGSNLKLGPSYLAKSNAQIKEFKARIALLEIHS